VEALDQVESRVHTTPEQCLMSITTIARQAQGMRAGEVIAKLVEDAYFMRVDNRVTQVPPVRNRQQDKKPQVAVRTSAATVLEGSYRPTPTVPGHRPVDPLMVATAPAAPVATVRSSFTVILAAEAATAGAPTTRLAGEPGAEATAAAEATRTATPPALHVAASTPAKRSKNFGATSPPRQPTMMASPPSLHGFTIYFSRRNSNLWGSPSTTRSRIHCSGSDATPSPSRTLVAITTRSASTSLYVWTKPRLHGSSHLRSTRSTSGTSLRNNSPATLRVLWVARVLAWT
jgi:hypothetical protein